MLLSILYPKKNVSDCADLDVTRDDIWEQPQFKIIKNRLPWTSLSFLAVDSEVNYQQVKYIIKLVFPEVPLAPCQNNIRHTESILNGDQQHALKARIPTAQASIFIRHHVASPVNISLSLAGALAISHQGVFCFP